MLINWSSTIKPQPKPTPTGLHSLHECHPERTHQRARRTSSRVTKHFSCCAKSIVTVTMLHIMEPREKKHQDVRSNKYYTPTTTISRTNLYARSMRDQEQWRRIGDKNLSVHINAQPSRCRSVIDACIHMQIVQVHWYHISLSLSLQRSPRSNCQRQRQAAVCFWYQHIWCDIRVNICTYDIVMMCCDWSILFSALYITSTWWRA